MNKVVTWSNEKRARTIDNERANENRAQWDL